MSAFEDFIQTELPLRPYTTTNPDLETIPVRRGSGPRELQFIDLAEGEVLGKVGGVLTGVTVASLSTLSYNHIQAISSNQWVINHNINSENFLVQIRDALGNIIISDGIKPGDAGGLDTPNNITVDFTSPVTGKAFIIFT
ncbi:MAG: hypothetical protein KUG64_11035 [Cycloclasticus sp.]|nr:hypothetical protein [Cycloclasticus sp.]